MNKLKAVQLALMSRHEKKEGKKKEKLEKPHNEKKEIM